MNDDEIRKLEAERLEKLRKIQETDTSRQESSTNINSHAKWKTYVTSLEDSLESVQMSQNSPENATQPILSTQEPSNGSESIQRAYTREFTTDWQNSVLLMSSRGGGLVPIAEEAEAWARRFYRGNRVSATLILSGDSGTGKTMISNRLRAWVERMAIECAMSGGWSRSPSTEWVDWVDWWERYQDGRPCRDLSDIISSDCLLLDDVGAESDRYKSGQNTAILCQILGKRERKFTVITTNIPKEKWGEKFDTRVADRLKRNGAVYVSFWGIKSFNG